MARWNGAVTPALELVAAHAHRLAGEALLEGSDRVTGDEAERIRDLHRLFALRQVAAHSGELLAGERLTAEQVRRLPDEVERVVADLERRPWGASDGQVVDRFGVHWLIGFEGDE